MRLSAFAGGLMFQRIIRQLSFAAVTLSTAVGAIAGNLSGSVSTSGSNTTISSYGTLDWALFGDGGALPGTITRSTTTGIGTSYTLIGAGTPSAFSNGQRRFSWSSGTPLASASNYTRGVAVSGVGNGFTVTLPADAQTRTVRVYYEVQSAAATFRASLSDSSAASYANNVTLSSGVRSYTVTYRADGPARTLKLDFTLTSGTGSVRLSGVAVPNFTYVNYAPTLTAPASLNVQRAQAVSVSLLGNDVNGDVLTYSATGLPPGLSINASTGLITGSPTTAGTYSSVVTVRDPSPLAATANITFNVAAGSVNTAPSGASATFSTPFETATTFSPTWTDPDSGDSWTVSILSQPANGTATVLGNQVTYTPNSGYVGTDNFNFRVTDSYNAFVDGTASGTVVGITPAQVTLPAATQGTQVGSVQVSWSSAVNAVSYDILRGTSASDLSPSLIGNTALLTYTDSTAPPGVQFFYSIRAKSGSATAVPSPTVLGFADTPPTSASATFSATLETPLEITPSYTDPDSGDVATFAVLTPATNGSAAVASNKIIYTPNTGYVGPESFTFTVTDRAGASVTGTATGTVTALTPAPVTAVTASQGTLLGSVSLSWASAANARSYRVLRGSSSFDPSPATIATVTSPSYSDATASPGTLYYYSVQSLTIGQEATPSATVLGFADTPPTAASASFAATLETPLQLNPTYTDPDSGDVGTFSIVSQPPNGFASVSANKITYSPNTGYVGPDSFTFTVTDRAGASVTGTATGTVTALTPAPVTAVSASQGTLLGSVSLSWGTANNARSYRILRGLTPSDPSPATIGTVTSLSYSDGTALPGTQYYYSVQSLTIGQEAAPSGTVLGFADTPPTAASATFAATLETPLQVNPTFTDPDSGDTASLAISTQPSNGSAGVAANKITYTPNTGYVGPDSFTFTVTDRAGAWVTGTATGTVTALTPSPVTTVTASQGTLLGSVALSWDAALNARSYRLLRGTSPADPAPSTIGTVTSLSYSDSTALPGTQYYYSVQSLTIGQQSTPSATVLGFADTPPTAASATFAATLESPLQVNPNYTDPDAGDVGTLSILSQPANGFAFVATNRITYTPNTGYVGPDSFTFTVTDRAGASVTGTASGTVTALTPAPVTTVTASQGTLLGSVSLAWSSATNARSYRVLRGVSPSDPAPLSIGTVTSPSYSDSTASPGTQYYYSVQSLTIGQEAAPSATVLGFADTPPTAASASFSATLETPLQVNPTYTDPDAGDVGSFSIVSQPANGFASVTANKITYSPNTGYVGPDSFTFTVTDRAGASVTGTATGTVTALTPAPVTMVTATQGTLLGSVGLSWSSASNARSYRVLRGVSPSDPSPATIGTVTSLSFSDSAALPGTQYYYAVQSLTIGQQASPSATVLGYADTPPSAASATFSASVNSPVTFAPTFTDPDPGDTATLAVTIQPSNGTVLISSGSFRYTPNAGYSGADTFTFTVTDRAGATATGVASGTVIIPTPDPISGLAATQGVFQNSVNLGWNSSVNATSYRVFRSTTSTDPAPSHIGVVAGNSFTDSGMPNGQGYFYFVQAYNLTVPSALSSAVYGFADTPPTAAAATFSTLESQTATFVPTWVDPDVGDVHTLAIVGQPAHGVASVSNNQLVYTPLAGYVGNDSFTFSVTDKAGATVSGQATGLIEPGVPQAPLGFVVSQGTVVGGVSLSWDNTLGSRQYLVSRSQTRSNPAPQVIATVDNNSFVDSNTTPGATYYYRIQGVGVAGVGPFSEEVSGYSDTPPTAASATASTIFNITVDFLPTISDPDPNESHKLAITAQPSNGVLSLTNELTGFRYVPNAGFSGIDNFTFTATDVAGATVAGTGSISVGCPTPTVSALLVSQPKIFANSGFTVSTSYGNTSCPTTLTALFEVLNGTTVVKSETQSGLPGAVSAPLAFAVDGLQPGTYSLRVTVSDTVTLKKTASTYPLGVPAFRMPSFTATAMVFAELDSATVAVGRSDDCALTSNRSAAIADHSICYYEVTNIPPGLAFDTLQTYPTWRGRPNVPGTYQPTLIVYQFDDAGVAKSLGETPRTTTVQPITAITFGSPATIDAAQYIQSINIAAKQTSGPNCPLTTNRAEALDATLRGNRSCFVAYSPLPPRSTLTTTGVSAYFLTSGTSNIGWEVSTFDIAGTEVKFASGSSNINVNPVDVNFEPNWGERNPIATVTKASIRLINSGSDTCAGTINAASANVPNAEKPCLIEWTSLPPGITQDTGTELPLLTGIFTTVGQIPVSYTVSYYDVEGNKRVLLEATKNITVDPPPLPKFAMKMSRPIGDDRYVVPDTGGILGILMTEPGSWPIDAHVKWSDETATTTYRVNRTSGLQILSATPAPLWTQRTVDVRLQLRDAPGLFTDKRVTVYSVPPDGVRLGLDLLNPNIPDSEPFPVTARVDMMGRNGPYYEAETMGAWAVQFGFKDSSSQFVPQGDPVPVDAQGVATSSLNPYGQTFVRVQAFAIPIGGSSGYVRKLDSPLRVASVVKGTPIEATIGMFRGGTEGPSPFAAVLRVTFKNRADQLANESVKWKSSSDNGATWTDVVEDGLQITQRLPEGRYLYKAIFKNRNTFVPSESNSLELRAWSVPKIAFTGSTFAFPGTATTLNVVLTHPSGTAVQSAVTQWTVNRRATVAAGAEPPPPVATGTGNVVTFTGNEPGTYLVSVKARMTASNADDPRAWGQSISQVIYGSPERPIARIIGPGRVEVGKPYTYELLLRTRFDLASSNLRLAGRWTLPDGTKVESLNPVPYTATDADFAAGKYISLKYEAWVIGYEETTLTSTSVSLPLWKYVWPTWSLNQSVVVPYAPTNSRINVIASDPALLSVLEGLTYSWTVPPTMRVNSVPTSKLDTTIDYGGTHPVSVTISDRRGNSSTLETTVTVAPAAPFVVNLPVKNMSSWSHAPIVAGATAKTSGGHPNDAIVTWAYYLNGTRLDLPNKNVASIPITTPGDYTVEVRVTSRMGATATGSSSVTVQPNVPATCVLSSTTTSGKTAVYLKSTCVDPDGSIVKYQWSVNGVVQTLAPGYKLTYVVPVGTTLPLRFDLTVTDTGGSATTSTINVN